MSEIKNRSDRKEFFRKEAMQKKAETYKDLVDSHLAAIKLEAAIQAVGFGIIISSLLHILQKFTDIVNYLGFAPSFATWSSSAGIIAFAIFSITRRRVSKIRKAATTCPRCKLPWAWSQKYHEFIETEKYLGKVRNGISWFQRTHYWQYTKCQQCGHFEREKKASEERIS